MVKSFDKYDEFLPIGLIQPNIDREVAWKEAVNGNFDMDIFEQLASWEQIREGFHYLAEFTPVPKIVLIPELTLPKNRVYDLDKLARKVDVVVIAGLDYLQYKNRLKNSGIVIIPNHWSRSRRSNVSSLIPIGKTYAAPLEEKLIKKHGYSFVSDPIVWTFETEKYGKFGISICYDLMDLERVFLYRGHINHLFVIAFNRDINSFYFLSEALSRTLFSNIIICNNAHYGGSLVTTPYYQPYKRTLYRHEGPGLSTVQVIEIPVRGLIEAAQGLDHKNIYKNLPPNLNIS